jgi:hypothetical protein
LRDEADLLQSAGGAIARSEFDRALYLLDSYDARFASGVLAEEALVLRVRALLAAGRRQEAQRTTADFERRRPESFYVPRLRALLQDRDGSGIERTTR